MTATIRLRSAGCHAGPFLSHIAVHGSTCRNDRAPGRPRAAGSAAPGSPAGGHGPRGSRRSGSTAPSLGR